MQTTRREGPSRRRFLQMLAALTAGGRAVLEAATAHAVTQPPEWPSLPRRRLGRTEFAASRLIFGCGAALSRQRRDDLLDAAFAAGINVFDVGSRDFYADAEANLAPFLGRVRDDVFLISKARPAPDLQPSDRLGRDTAKAAAALWTRRLEGSLRDLGVERVDAYSVMAVNHPDLVASEEILSAFDKVRRDGKVRHLGLSTHQNAGPVLEAAVATGQYSLAMVAVTPAGWYDLPSRGFAAGTRPLLELAPLFERARAAGIGLIGMKAGRYLTGGRLLGWSRPSAFDQHYGDALLRSELSAFQRSYAYVLEHGLDVVNADMQSLEHLHENVVAAATSAAYAG